MLVRVSVDGKRRRQRLARTLAAGFAAAALAAPAAAYGYPYPGAVAGDTAIRDPTMIVREGEPTPSDDMWILYGTFNQSRISFDRYRFSNAFGFAHAPQPWWREYSTNSTPWAPDVRYNFDGKYWMYYAMTNTGSQKSAIGLATSSNGYPGTWIDHGSPILTSNSGSPYNAIDPHLLVDYGTRRMWLTFGSYYGGIYTVEVNTSTGLPKGPTHRVAANPRYHHWIEGADLTKWGPYYYLFFSEGDCCVGHNSNYHVRVGRSTSPTGPFHDKNGNSLLNGGGTTVLASHDWVRGPGGQSIEWDPVDDRFFMLYHYWDLRKPESAGTQFGINWIDWDANHWPYVH